jgi:hypothetical protein
MLQIIKESVTSGPKMSTISISYSRRSTMELIEKTLNAWSRIKSKAVMASSIICALISRIQYITRPTNALWFYGCNFIAWWSPTCFGHQRGHLQGGENRNTNTVERQLTGNWLSGTPIIRIRLALRVNL